MSKEGKKEVQGVPTPLNTKVDGKMFEEFATFIEKTYNDENIYVGCRRAVYDLYFPIVIIVVETSIPVPIRKEIIFDLLRTERPDIESALKGIISDIHFTRELFRNNEECVIGINNLKIQDTDANQRQVPIEAIDRALWGRTDK